VKYRSSSAVTKMAVRLGSSDSDYLYYEFTKDFENVWREVSSALAVPEAASKASIPSAWPTSSASTT
jgi:hypothetical protein